MSNSTPASVIRLRGVRHNNLKNFDLDLPTGRLIVITGLSGSGKSSLAFDTLYAEGQRRYIETFSPYARQFFDRMDKPQVDKIEGIPPAIAIEQRNTVRTTRSTVGTMTEICDYMKIVWAHLAQLHCRECSRPVRKDSPQQIWERLKAEMGDGRWKMEDRRSKKEDGRSEMGDRRSTLSESNSQPPTPNFHLPTSISDLLITFDLPLSGKLSMEESLALIAKQGYQRLLVPKHVAARQAATLVLREAQASFGAPNTQFSEADEIVRLDEAVALLNQSKPASLTVIQDRLRLSREHRARFVEACEQAYHFGKGRLAVHVGGLGSVPDASRITRHFSERLHCAECDIEYREPSPALFSFNNPVGACPACRGFGRTITIDYNLAIPNHSLTLAQGAVKPWQTGQGAECQTDLAKFCRHQGIPMDAPFSKLSPEHQRWVLEGDPDYGKDEEHEWPRAWYGVKGYFRWLESRAYKMHVRVLLSRYRAYRTCPDCHGKRLKPEALLYRVSLPNSPDQAYQARRTRREEAHSSDRANKSLLTSAPTVKENGGGLSLSLADFYQLSVARALQFMDGLKANHGKRKANDPLALVLTEVRSRLAYLDEVGLGYLTLDRPTRSLSGGETERVSLTTCLGSRLVNTLFVLDEPSVGLHARDTARLIQILQRLRDAGNTVIVVEHEASVMRAADQIVDLGPGHGEAGGALVFQGTVKEIFKSLNSLTGAYLSGRTRIEIPKRRTVTAETPKLILEHASLHNLKNLTVEIPLGRLVCVTGVSGSGKTTLVREVLMPLLCERFLTTQSRPAAQRSAVDDVHAGSEPDELGQPAMAPPRATISGWEQLGRVVLVDQSPLGRTPRSNPAVYIGAFDQIRELFAQSDLAKQRGLNASAFSFNSSQGQCETCRGAGFEKIEMQFLSDVYIRCPECNGRRYRPHILEVKVSRPLSVVSGQWPVLSARDRRSRLMTDHGPRTTNQSWSIADLLDATVDEAVDFLSGFEALRPAERAMRDLKLLQEIGVGYLRLGQPINTLSGGESQRLKLVSYLAEFQQAESIQQKPTLFLFDEPTTGLHFDDVRVLLRVFQRLGESGHAVLIIEHNVDVIKCADWLIDLGPEAGDGGGEVVVAGTPETVARCERSHTGRAIKSVLNLR